MAWYIAKFRRTVRGAWTQSYVIAPDGALLDLVSMDERGKPRDLNAKMQDRLPGIVHRWRGKVGNSGEDHYWVNGNGQGYAVVEEDLTTTGEARLTVVQWPMPVLTTAQEEHLEVLGIPEPMMAQAHARERTHPFVRVEASVANQSPAVFLTFRARDDRDWSLDPKQAVAVSMSLETALALGEKLVKQYPG